MAEKDETTRRKGSTSSGELNPGGHEYEQVAPEGSGGTDSAVGDASKSGSPSSSGAARLDAGDDVQHHPVLEREGGPKQPETDRVQRGR